MPIPADQCAAWRNQGAIRTAQATHEAVRTALDALESPMRSRQHQIYLQGSYKNDTNIRADSDVDVVVQLNETWYEDIRALPLAQHLAYKSAFSAASYSLNTFTNDVLVALRKHFGNAAVTAKNKCITVEAGQGRLSADVVVCAQYRKYSRFHDVNDQDYAEGITFWGRHDGLQVVNFPKLHYANGVAKNGQTEWYKASVRMFKNARKHLVDRGLADDGLAPSYFLECWLYNIPHDRFIAQGDDTFVNVLRWLHENPAWSKFVCQNRQQTLFGPESTQWSLADAVRTRDLLTALWSDWDNR